jgi:hypothetical protein
MAQKQLTGMGLRFPGYTLGESANSMALSTTNALMDAGSTTADSERVAMIGRVWWPDRASHAVRKIHFLTAAVSGTDSAANIVRVSIQGVSVVAGPPPIPDDTILGASNNGYALLSFAGAVLNSTKDNTWITTGALVADVTLAPGALIAVDFIYTARSDASLALSGFAAASAAIWAQTCNTVAYVGAPAWAALTMIPNVILEDDSGAIFGTLFGAIPFSSQRVTTFNTGTATDETALAFTPEVTMKVDGAYVWMKLPASTAVTTVSLYEGEVLKGSADIDENTTTSNATNSSYFVPFASEVTLTAGTTYYLSVRASTANSIMLYGVNLAAAGHRVCLPGGTAVGYSTRDGGAGAFAATTTTTVPFMGFTVSSIDDGVSAGGGIPAGVLAGIIE